MRSSMFAPSHRRSHWTHKALSCFFVITSTVEVLSWADQEEVKVAADAPPPIELKEVLDALWSGDSEAKLEIVEKEEDLFQQLDGDGDAAKNPATRLVESLRL